MWGYEDTTRNPEEALRFYRQAADLGLSDAHIRIGQLQEYGKGTARSPSEALMSYQRAAEAGNFFGYAYIAKLLSRTAHRRKAEGFWEGFFKALEADPEPRFLADTPGGLIHAYLELQLRFGLRPTHVHVIRDHGAQVIAHHQQLLEHATSSAQL